MKVEFPHDHLYYLINCIPHSRIIDSICICVSAVGNDESYWISDFLEARSMGISSHRFFLFHHSSFIIIHNIMSDNTIRASILGTGLSLTAFHHPLLKALPELFTVHSVLERSGKETCRSIVGDDVKIVKTYEEVIEDKDVDLVVVSTPNRTHFDYVKRALEAGKHG
jgi:hypothetical protein